MPTIGARTTSVLGEQAGFDASVLGEQAGFDTIWASGFEISASHGLPDANILGMAEQLAASRKINDAVSIPVISDCDNGYAAASGGGVTVFSVSASQSAWQA